MSSTISCNLICSFLKQKNKNNIVGLDLIQKTKYPKFKFYKCDILDYEKLDYIFKNEKINEVYHLVAYLSAKAENKMNEGTFEILEHQTNVKIMGPTIFSDLSKMMSKSLHITKWCLLADAGLFGLSILL